MIASLSFSEWQRAYARNAGRLQPATVQPNTVQPNNACLANARYANGGQSLTALFFLLSLSLFSLALFVGGWYGSLPMAEWSVILLAVLSALSITQTLFVARSRQRSRPESQRISTIEGG